MKKGITMFLIGLVSGILIAVVAVMIILPQQMFLVNESKLSFDQTAENIIQSTEDNKWSMPHQYDLQATMKKHGFSVNPVKVFSLCKPEHAHKVLKGDNERIVSALMPCRVAIYETKEGKTYVTRLNAALFSKFLGKKLKKIMGDVAFENEVILNSVIKK